LTEQEYALRRFYHEVLVPLAGQEAAPSHADQSSRDTFFISRDPSEHIRREAEVPLADALVELWSAPDPQLVDCARSLANLQHLFARPAEDQREVSPFLYAMF
jgi:hypothetical protein